MKRILSIVFIGSLLLTGCASSGKPEANSLSREEPVATTMEKQELTADSGNLPEWLTPYTALGELPAPTLIHISRENPEFSVNEHIAFPVCSVLCVTKDVAGTDLTLLNMNSDEIAALVEKIEKASVISEEEAVNPDAHLLGYEFSIVLRAADGNYMLTKMSAFDDGRVNITIEDGETSQALWVKSQTLIEKMQQLADYEPFEKDTVKDLSGIVIVDAKGDQYPLSDEAVTRVQEMLGRMHETSGDYKCPFDVDLILKTSEKEIEAKYCHDSCGVLFIQGYYYVLEEQDAEWLKELINGTII